MNKINNENYTNNIVSIISKIKLFYIELDNYDEYYKHEIKNKIISIFNILLKPNLCQTHYKSFIENNKDIFLKFIINMNEINNICIDNFIYYYKKNIYNVLTNQYYNYIRENSTLYKYLLKNSIEHIDESVINVAISKINNNIYGLTDLLEEKNNIYNILIFLLETLIILDEKGFIKNMKEDSFFNLEKKELLYSKMLKICDCEKQLETIENFNMLIKKIDDFEIQEEENYDNIPDEYLDPIGNILIKNPIILPSSNVIMEEEIIKKHLLYHNFDPFNREELNINMLKEYNQKDEIKKKIEIFKNNISEWLLEN